MRDRELLYPFDISEDPLPGYTNNELEIFQREARSLFGDKSLRARQFGQFVGVVVRGRLVVHDADTNSWYVAYAPADQPHLLYYVGAPVRSPEDVTERRLIKSTSEGQD